jgi:cobalt/nickel transport system permease protein
VTPIERALSHVSTLDDLARRGTPVGRLDARAKVLVVFGFLVTLASYGRHDIVQPLPLLVFLTVGMALGDVPWRIILARLAIASPFAILVGIWNPLFETRPLLQLGPLVLSAGWVSCLSVIERFVFAVAAVLLLIATTGFDAVAAALGRLGMPRVLMTQLLLLYRYGFLLGGETSRMLRAHALRAPLHPRPTLRTMRSLLGELLIRSLARAERVHMAMLCRGFDGEIRRKSRMQFRVQDATFVAGSVGFFALVRVVDVPRWLAGIVL